MKSHYRPPPSKWSVATAVMAAVIVVVAGAYAFFDEAVTMLPTVTAPDMTRSFSKSESPHIPAPPPMPKTATVPAPRFTDAPGRRLGPGIYRCEDANGAVTYSDSPCGDGKLVDTKPTSGGFADNWSISVKHR